MDIDKVDSIIERHEGEKGALIAVLHSIQEEFNYLPQDLLTRISEKMGIPLTDIYGVATFFKYFSLKPRGKHVVTVCSGTACHVRGGTRILEKLERKLGIEAGDTTEDGLFSLESVNCLGCCAIGPIMVVDGEYYGQINIAKAGAILDQYASKR